MNGTQIRVLVVDFGGLSAAGVRRSSMQTLLVGVALIRSPVPSDPRATRFKISSLRSPNLSGVKIRIPLIGVHPCGSCHPWLKNSSPIIREVFLDEVPNSTAINLQDCEIRHTKSPLSSQKTPPFSMTILDLASPPTTPALSAQTSAPARSLKSAPASAFHAGSSRASRRQRGL